LSTVTLPLWFVVDPRLSGALTVKLFAPAASGLLAVDDPAAEPLARRYSLPPGHAPVLADTGDARYQAFNGTEIVRAARWMPEVVKAMRGGSSR